MKAAIEAQDLERLRAACTIDLTAEDIRDISARTGRTAADILRTAEMASLLGHRITRDFMIEWICGHIK